MLGSRKKLKETIHGRHPLLEPRGSDLVLTKLGEKIAILAAHREKRLVRI